MEKQKEVSNKKKGPPAIGDLVEFLEERIVSLYPDVDKFDSKGNNTAGVRIRINLQEIVYCIKEIRQEILTRQKKRRARKNRTKKREIKKNVRKGNSATKQIF